ncbi:MAG: WD40 repeat domain-containing protein [Myxococcota bacterium]
MSPTLVALALAALTPDPLIAGKPFVLRGGTETVTALAVSPDGKAVAAGSRDKTVRVWSLPEGALLRSVPGGEGQINALAFSPDGARLAIGDSGFQVRVVDVASGEVTTSLAHPSPVSGLDFSPDGTLLAVAGQTDSGAVYALADGKRRYEVRGRTVTFSGDGRQLLAGNGAGSLLVIDVKSGKAKKTIATAPHLPWATWTRDGKLIVSWNGTEADVHLWTPAGKAAGVLPGPGKTGFGGAGAPVVRGFAMTADGATAVTGCGDGLVRVWDVKAKTVRKTLPSETVSSVALSSDGAWLVVSDGALVKLWRLAE